MNVKITVDYIGTNYHGWQIQNGHDTIQERLEKAVCDLTGQRVTVCGSGRTDAGVHAIGQVANFTLDDTGRSYNFVKGINHFLPQDIRVLTAEVVSDRFHARFSAKRKTYVYRIYEGITDRAVFLNRAMRVYGSLDVDKMNQCASYLVGEHDFVSFMSTGSSVQSTVRNLYELHAERKDGLVEITATANGFLYNMVRRLASCLIKAGKGDILPSDAKQILESKDGLLIKDIVPACGLYLKSVEYDE